MDLAWCPPSVRSRTFPGQSDLAHECMGQPQLPTSAGNQPPPTVGCLSMARADGRPSECLVEEAECVLHREATQIPAPQHAQIRRQPATDPGQPSIIVYGGQQRRTCSKVVAVRQSSASAERVIDHVEHATLWLVAE